MPRDRNGGFESQPIRKGQRRFDSLNDKILFGISNDNQEIALYLAAVSEPSNSWYRLRY